MSIIVNEVANSTVAYENLVVDAIAAWIQPNIEGIDEGCVFKRNLTAADPNGSIGVLFLEWYPAEHEIGQSQPTFGRYLFAIQTQTRSADEEEARALHGAISKSVRRGLYGPSDLRVSLRSITVEDETSIERFSRFDVERQSSTDIESEGNHLFISQLTFWVETNVTELH